MTITYTPANDARDAARPAYLLSMGAFKQHNRPAYEAMTKAQLMDSGYVAIHESYSKAELVDDALAHLWREQPTFKEFNELADAAEVETTILERIESAWKDRDRGLASVRDVAKSFGKPYMHIANLLKCTKALHREQVELDLWERVEILTAPGQHTPAEALRLVLFEAVNQALDDLEDNTEDLATARIRARWARQNGALVGLKELQA